MRFPTVAFAAVSAALLSPLILSVPSASAAADKATLHGWTSNADFRLGKSAGLKISKGNLTIAAKKTRSTKMADAFGKNKKKRPYDYGVWVSPWVTPNHDIASIIPSWEVSKTPKATWVRVFVRARTASTTGSWDEVATWSLGKKAVHRRTATAQRDDLTRLDVDTVLANPGQQLKSWQVKVWLGRAQGASNSPVLGEIRASAASYTKRSIPTSKTTMKTRTELAVPRYSQMIHLGQHRQWGGGGQAWCSPTSTSMIMNYFKAGPRPKKYAFAKNAEPWVNHAAKFTYDFRYGGTGNWPFNTAYAARYGLKGFVTRLPNLRKAEALIKTGVPIAAGISFGRGQLTGAPISSTPGHLVVIVGFEADGRVIVNDPAGANSAGVRRVYDRAQFERAWMSGSGGIAYVIHPESIQLPNL